MFSKDPNIVLSYINTKLRDEFDSIDDLCLSLDIDKSELDEILNSIDYYYNKDYNKYIKR